MHSFAPFSIRLGEEIYEAQFVFSKIATKYGQVFAKFRWIGQNVTKCRYILAKFCRIFFRKSEVQKMTMNMEFENGKLIWYKKKHFEKKYSTEHSLGMENDKTRPAD